MYYFRFGIYPITAFALCQPPPPKTRAVSPENQNDPVKQDTPNPKDDSEARRFFQILASADETNVKGEINLLLYLRFEDGMNRQLSCAISTKDDPGMLADELVEVRFIHPQDHGLVAGLLADIFRKLAIKSACSLVIELNNTEEVYPNAATNGDDPHSTPKVKRTPEEVQELKDSSLFCQMKDYSEDNTSNADPKLASTQRDPKSITSKYPLPDGAFFCPPATEEGSLPFRVPPPGTNAFDCSHLEVPPQPTYTTQPSTDSASYIYTPSNYNNQDSGASYDPSYYLQGAQKVLENLSGPGQQPYVATHEPPSGAPPAVTPGGIVVSPAVLENSNNQQPQGDQQMDEAVPQQRSAEE